MKRCEPADMRKNLEVVEVLKKAGVDFVAIPALSEMHKMKLLVHQVEVLQKLSEMDDEEMASESS